jgi:hypothetical protein
MVIVLIIYIVKATHVFFQSHTTDSLVPNTPGSEATGDQNTAPSTADENGNYQERAPQVPDVEEVDRASDSDMVMLIQIPSIE